MANKFSSNILPGLDYGLPGYIQSCAVERQSDHQLRSNLRHIFGGIYNDFRTYWTRAFIIDSLDFYQVFSVVKVSWNVDYSHTGIAVFLQLFMLPFQFIILSLPKDLRAQKTNIMNIFIQNHHQHYIEGEQYVTNESTL